MPLDQKVLYLTFDDGPTPEITNWTLDLLKSYNAKATFFCIGNNIEQYPEIFADILNDGHAIGNHTYEHPLGWNTNTDIYVDEVTKTQDIINFEIENIKSQIPNSINCLISESDYQQSKIINHQSTTRPYRKGTFGRVPKLFRPPYGKIKPKQGRRLIEMDYKIIMWDILAFDWKESITPDQCANNVIYKAENGSIVVFHDSYKASKNMMYALPKVLDYFSEKGFSFKHL